MNSYFIHWLMISTILHIRMLKLSQFWLIRTSPGWFVYFLDMVPLVFYCFLGRLLKLSSPINCKGIDEAQQIVFY